ncbi:MAG: hypothetical protein GC192_22430 [Bacteroidetes bacterium]|nr:hypothetical protein [Bacteroidota bacterium]
MATSKKILLEIVKLFIAVLFANWLISLGNDKPFLSENPIRWLVIILAVSAIGGYGKYKLVEYFENKKSRKLEEV